MFKTTSIPISISPDQRNKQQKYQKRTQSTNSNKQNIPIHYLPDLVTCLSTNFSKAQPMTPIINLNSISFQSSAQCGYCQGHKSARRWVTSGFSCNLMSLKCYQLLMDRGWRRSGIFYYRPTINKSCCQAFTIRLDVNKYARRTFEKKVLKKVQNLRGPTQQLETIEEEPKDEEMMVKLQGFMNKLQIQMPIQLLGNINSLKKIRIGNEEQIAKEFHPVIDFIIAKVFDRLDDVVSSYVDPTQQFNKIAFNLLKQLSNNYSVYEIFASRGSKKIQNIMKTNKFPYATNILTLFDAYFQRRLNLEFNVTEKKYNQNNKLLQIIKSILELATQKFPLVQIGIKSRQPIILMNNESSQQMINLKINIFKFFQNQMPVVNQKVLDKLKKKNQEEQEQLTIKWVRAKFESDSFLLFTNYQREIHKKEYVSEHNYRNFLCKDALQRWDKLPLTKDGKTLECGCWHMKYYLQDSLIAVGVIDILPMSVSSVYFFYDPKYKKYSLGVYGALQEIKFIKEMQQLGHPFFQYYYMGFYIQDNQKMAYKGDYRPSELLCPITYRWVPLDEELKKRISKIKEDSMKNCQDLSVELSNREGHTEVDLEFQNFLMEDYIKQNVKISINNQIHRITQIKKQYQEYFLNLFLQLLPIIGKTLIKDFEFQSK